MPTETPRQKNRASKIMQEAWPDLTEREIKRLMNKAQAVRRGERDYALLRCDDGAKLTIHGLDKS